MFAVTRPTLEKPVDFFFLISQKKKKKLPTDPLFFATVLFFFCFLFVCLFVCLLFLKTWGTWKIWVNNNTNIWKAWMLKLECFFDLEKEGFHTRTTKKFKERKKKPWPTDPDFFLTLRQTKEFFLMPNQALQGRGAKTLPSLTLIETLLVTSLQRL